MQQPFIPSNFHVLYFTSSFLDNQNFFMQIFVWSMKTGRLLDVLSGHEGPVHGLMFSPINVRECSDILCMTFFLELQLVTKVTTL